MTRPTHFLAFLSLTTALLSVTPAHAAFEFIKKAAPKEATAPVAAPVVQVKAPATVPVTNLTPEVAAPVAPVPVWTAQQAPIVSSAPASIPLTPIVRDTDSLAVLDAPLLPDMDQLVAPARETLATQSASNVSQSVTPAPVVSKSSRDSVLWDKPAAAVEPVITEAPIMAADHLAPMTTSRTPMRAPEPIVETILETPQPAIASAPSDDVVVEGFGSGLPMVMALRQIVPAHYRFSFGPGVDPGQRVDWQGGKLWSQIVQDVAQSKGLQTEIAGNVVAVRRLGTSHVPTTNSAANSNMMEDVVLGASTFESAPVAPSAPIAPAVTPKRTMLSSSTVSSETSRPLPIINAHQDAQSQNTQGKAPVSLLALPDEKPLEKMPVVNKSIDVATVEPSAAKSLPPIIEEDHVTASLPMPLMDVSQPVAVAAPKTPIVGADLDAKQEWLALNGKTLRSVLQDWSQQAGVSLVWSSDFDYPLQTDIRIAGTYPEAVRTLLAGFNKAQPKPTGRLHKNSGVGAQPVLIVDTPRLINNR
jgi:hypothetical protein